jgi:hypothetical protein
VRRANFRIKDETLGEAPLSSPLKKPVD